MTEKYISPHGDCETVEVKLAHQTGLGHDHAEIEKPVADIAQALNSGGLQTEYSCGGHGMFPGSIMLEDGRSLLIFDDHEDFVNEHHRLLVLGKARDREAADD